MNGFCLVSPASRGIGFALAKHLLKITNTPLVATARRDCEGTRQRLLDGIPGDKELHVLPADVTDESSIAALATHIRQYFRNTPLRLALTMPGVLHVEKSPAQIDAAKALDSFKVNTLGPLLLLKHLTPFLPTRSSPNPAFHPASNLPGHAVYAMMAARVGSVSDNRLGGWYSYRASKTAVFQLAKTLDAYLQASSEERAMAVALHPGTVRTDFTREFWDTGNGMREMLEPDDAAAKLIKVLCGLDVADGRGRCWDWRGEEVVP